MKKSIYQHVHNKERNEAEAMTIICNIQMMQDKIHSKHFDYGQFSGNSIEELRKLQERLIPEYNATFKK